MASVAVSVYRARPSVASLCYAQCAAGWCHSRAAVPSESTSSPTLPKCIVMTEAATTADALRPMLTSFSLGMRTAASAGNSHSDSASTMMTDASPSPPLPLTPIATTMLDALHSEPPRPERCWMASLADVELQLIAHALDTRSRVRLARCSRRLMHTAQDAFAWRHCNPHVVSGRITAALIAGLSAPLCLARFVPLVYVATAAADCSPDVVQLLAAVPNLTSIDARCSDRIGWSNVQSLMQREAVQQGIRSLALPRAASIVHFACTARMPLLRTLLLHYHAVPALVRSSFGASLTRLHISDLPPCPVLNLSALSALRTLHLSQALWSDCQLAHMFRAAPAMCATLQCLTLHANGMRAEAAIPITEAACATLVALHTLRLISCRDNSALLTIAQRPPQLRTVVVDLGPAATPTSARLLRRLRSLLEARPHLQMHVLCARSAAEAVQATVHAAGDESAAVMNDAHRSKLKGLCTLARLPRVTVGPSVAEVDVMML